jgi:hypothetical protein
MICNGVSDCLPCRQKGILLPLTVVMHCSTINIVLTDHMIKSMRFCNVTAQSVHAVSDSLQATHCVLNIQHRQGIFIFTIMFRLILGTTLPPTGWV